MSQILQKKKKAKTNRSHRLKVRAVAQHNDLGISHLSGSSRWLPRWPYIGEFVSNLQMAVSSTEYGRVSSHHNAGCYLISEIFLSVAYNTIKKTNQSTTWWFTQKISNGLMYKYLQFRYSWRFLSSLLMPFLE